MCSPHTAVNRWHYPSFPSFIFPSFSYIYNIFLVLFGGFSMKQVTLRSNDKKSRKYFLRSDDNHQESRRYDSCPSAFIQQMLKWVPFFVPGFVKIQGRTWCVYGWLPTLKKTIILWGRQVRRNKMEHSGTTALVTTGTWQRPLSPTQPSEKTSGRKWYLHHVVKSKYQPVR